METTSESASNEGIFESLDGSVEGINNEIDISMISENLGKMYLNEDMADVHFLLKDDNGQFERIPAHKTLLAMSSEKFKQIFYGESMNAETNVDASAAAFKEFLRCFYLSKMKLSIENVTEVMSLCEKYEVGQCMAACSYFLQRYHTADNVCHVYQLAIHFNRAKLKKTCEESHISKNTEEVLQSNAFLACNKAVLREILRIDEFSCPESVVFEACMFWVKKASKQIKLTKELIQTHLGDLFYQIRFRSMHFTEFTHFLPSFGHLFSADEYNDVLQLISNEQYQPKLFTGNRRKEFQFEWNETGAIQCNRTIQNIWTLSKNMYIKKVETTTITINKALLLGQILCSINRSNGKTLKMLRAEVTIQRNQYQNVQPKIIYQGELDVLGYSIKLLKPVLIRPNIDHNIQLRLNIPENAFYYNVILNTEIHLESNVIVRFSNDPKTDDHQPTGVIAALHFNAA